MTWGAVTPEPIEKLVAAWRKEGVPPEIIKRRLDLPGEERVGGQTVERIDSSLRSKAVPGWFRCCMLGSRPSATKMKVLQSYSACFKCILHLS